MHKPRELYEKRVSLTLAGFQVTELLLKDYIATSYDVMRGLLSSYIAFSPSRKDIENHSLERLISIFKTINGNHELISNLQSVVEHRNQIAHKSLLPLYGSDTSDNEYWKLIDKISPLEQEIDKCMDGVQKELVELKRKAGLVHSDGERGG
jgi:uncharacterized protein Yka (UPF0111/DUF47 family)